jgi:SAM-dependent methyltransferase
VNFRPARALTDARHGTKAETVEDGALLFAARHQSAEERRAETIAAVARDLGRSVPPPRGAPFFYLDAPLPAYGLEALDPLSRRGIFRKYELVLEIGCGLGARTRWLAAHLGCRLVGVDSREDVVAAALLLNRRARIEGQVQFQVGHPAHLPLRQRCFTHVWMLEPDRWAPTADAAAEAFRVLRPGGHVAIHGLQPTEERTAPVLDVLRASGFIDLEACPVRLHDVPVACRLARERLWAALHAAPPPAPVPAACMQVFGRRPG